jgi:hypothetical protein
VNDGLIEERLAKKGFTHLDDEYKSAAATFKEAYHDFNKSLTDAHIIMDKIPISLYSSADDRYKCTCT